MHDYQNQRDRFVQPTRHVLSIRPNGAWFKHQARNLRDFFIVTWLDWLTFVIIGATAAGVSPPSHELSKNALDSIEPSTDSPSQVWVAPHTHNRLFPVTDPTSAVYWPSIAHPYIEPIFSPAAAGLLAALIPILSFALTQLWQQSFVDFASAVLGLAYSMVTGTCFQVILKKTIGGLRPHFLGVCKPVIPDGLVGVGFEGIFYTADQVCTGNQKDIGNALESFPSGHAEVAFAGFGYLAIYLFAHLRITSLTRRRGSHWRMLLVVAPLLLATYLASTLVLGYHHHAYDVFFGAFIGWFMAFMGYRTVYMGVFDGRWNTVPYLKLPPGDGERGGKRSVGSEETAFGDGEADGRPVTNGMLHGPRFGDGQANGSAV